MGGLMVQCVVAQASRRRQKRANTACNDRRYSPEASGYLLPAPALRYRRSPTIFKSLPPQVENTQSEEFQEGPCPRKN